jgi:hypothetical protein
MSKYQSMLQNDGRFPENRPNYDKCLMTEMNNH